MPDGEGRVFIDVNDRGTGIDPEIEAHAFEPFISGKTAVGRGMGLTVARTASATLGGDIQLLHRKGGGTTAEVEHPLVQPVY
jgi:C4-dicarboxylate-specific signal transduction histidine kinase